MKTIKEIPFNDIFSSAVELYVDHFPRLVSLSTAAFFPMLVRDFLLATFNKALGALATLFFPVAIGVFLFFFLALLGTISLCAKNTEVVRSEVMAEVWERFSKSLGAFLLFLFLLMVGAICLVLPAVYVAVVFCFVLFSILFENKGIIDAFKRSKELTDGIFWKLLGAHIMILLLFAVVMLPMGLAFSWIGIPLSVAIFIRYSVLVVLLPLAVAFYYFVFIDIKQQKDGVLKISVYAKDN